MIRILKEAETNRAAIFAREDPVGSVEEPVRAILEDVKANGDAALKKYTKEFDGADIPTVEVGMGAIDDGFRNADPFLVDILYRAAERVAAFHQHQVRNSFLVNEESGVVMGQKIIPLERVGLYVPGGTAAYPSSVIMNCIPAKLAGVKEIFMVTPPDKNGKVPANILAAARICGVNRVFRVGGAQAIAALASGTSSHLVAHHPEHPYIHDNQEYKRDNPLEHFAPGPGLVFNYDRDLRIGIELRIESGKLVLHLKACGNQEEEMWGFGRDFASEHILVFLDSFRFYGDGTTEIVADKMHILDVSVKDHLLHCRPFHFLRVVF